LSTVVASVNTATAVNTGTGNEVRIGNFGSSGSFVETILEKWEDSPRQFCEEGEPWNPVRESSSRP
jgi:hypothetical protein